MKLRFLADADFNRRIVAGVIRRENQVDFLTQEYNSLAGLPDTEVLALAAAENRVLVSHDLRTMPAAFTKFVTQTESPGLLLISQSMQIGAAVDSLLRIWEDTEAHEWKNRIVWLPR